MTENFWKTKTPDQVIEDLFLILEESKKPKRSLTLEEMNEEFKYSFPFLHNMICEPGDEVGVIALDTDGAIKIVTGLPEMPDKIRK